MYSSSGLVAYWCLSQGAPGSQVIEGVLEGAARRMEQFRGLSGLDLAAAIFLNNIRPLYDPALLLLWLLPGMGLVITTLTVVVNGALLGAVIAKRLPELGAITVAACLVPHGTIELPAMVLLFSAMLCWQLFTIRLIGFAIRRAGYPSPLSLLDVVTLASTSVVLFLAAALIEALITPVIVALTLY